MVKKNAPTLLEQYLQKPKYQPATIALSGNTDCYQPVERKLKITRELLKVFLKYQHPVGIITKNTLIARDLDLLAPLAQQELTRVHFSITTLNESLRRKMEPRTSTSRQKLNTIEKLSQQGIPVSIMIGPIIPGLNDHEIPDIMSAAAQAGARSAGFTMVRLNGQIGQVFEDWLRQAYPDRAEKILNQIRGAHGGKLNDSRFGKRMKGDGIMVESIHRMFELSKKKYFGSTAHRAPLRTDLFVKTHRGQMGLF